MSGDDRRVGVVRLRAPSDALVRRGAVLLEDALRTASLPGGDGRVVVVRALNVGPIRAGHSSAALALAIEKRMRGYTAGAIHAEAPGASTAPAVYFRDAVEPYSCLIRQVVRREPANAWFWPLAVPGWRPGAPADRAAVEVLGSALRTEPGVVAAARIVTELHAVGALDALLTALRPEDGSAFLRACGWARPVAADPSAGLGAPAPVSQPWHAAVVRAWALRWGARDERTLWLAAVVLVSVNPARALDPRLTERAAEAIRGATLDAPEARGESRPPPTSAPTFAPDPDAAAIHPVAPNHPPKGEQPARGVESARSAPDVPAGADAGAPRSSPQADGTRAPRIPLSATGSDAARSPSFENATFGTAFGGLLFVLPILARLGLPAWLRANPEFIEREIPARILNRVARSLGIDEDPILSALPPITTAAGGCCPFVMPASWWQHLTRPGPLVARVRPGARALLDPSGRIPLALWRGPRPESVRELVAGRAVRRGPPLPRATDVSVLCAGWARAARRWCRRFAGVPFGELVRRPGRVTVTPTHVDIRFDPRDADVRIRRAGLDIDPGWVPWFGRVVRFHYAAEPLV